MTTRNRHPADELADVRAEIRALQQRESELRAELLNGGNLIGEDFVAEIKTRRQVRLDADAIRKHFGADALRRFTVERLIQQIYLWHRADET